MGAMVAMGGRSRVLRVRERGGRGGHEIRPNGTVADWNGVAMVWLHGTVSSHRTVESNASRRAFLIISPIYSRFRLPRTGRASSRRKLDTYVQVRLPRAPRPVNLRSRDSQTSDDCQISGRD